MQFQFSQKLTEEAIEIFKDEDGLVVSPEKAREYLEGLAGLFLAFLDDGDRSNTSVENERPLDDLIIA